MNVEIVPSEQLVKASAKEVTINDALGREIVIRKPKPLDNLDFKRALGPNHTNTLYLVEVSHLPYVASIDGIVVAVPTTDAELRALYARLGDEGNEAAQKAVIDTFFSTVDASEGELKNS
jgi:hypothetical protein